MREISPPDFGWKNVPYFIDGIEVGVQTFPIDDSRAELERVDQCSKCYGFHSPWENHWTIEQAREAGGRI